MPLCFLGFCLSSIDEFVQTHDLTILQGRVPADLGLLWCWEVAAKKLGEGALQQEKGSWTLPRNSFLTEFLFPIYHMMHSGAIVAFLRDRKRLSRASQGGEWDP